MTSEQAIAAARSILEDLKDRRGVGDEIDACDLEVQAEMVETWANIIHCAVNMAPKGGIEE
jgi:hypothetical protein